MGRRSRRLAARDRGRNGWRHIVRALSSRPSLGRNRRPPPPPLPRANGADGGFYGSGAKPPRAANSSSSSSSSSSSLSSSSSSVSLEVAVGRCAALLDDEIVPWLTSYGGPRSSSGGNGGSRSSRSWPTTREVMERFSHVPDKDAHLFKAALRCVSAARDGRCGELKRT